MTRSLTRRVATGTTASIMMLGAALACPSPAAADGHSPVAPAVVADGHSPVAPVSAVDVSTASSRSDNADRVGGAATTDTA